MPKQFKIFSTLLGLFLACVSCTSTLPKADLIVENAVIWTGNSAQSSA
ncbi:hypothetical protein [Cellulophaga sp. E6(2014)]|jgi:hypothetical protein|nr:hypothetical protein [Cellulophaga sp. E6(2014)]